LRSLVLSIATNVPEVTVQEKGFIGASASLNVDLDPLNPSDNLYPFNITASLTITGSLVFDFWSKDDTHFVVNNIPLLGDVGFINPPDYTDNTPIHIIPGIQDPIGNAEFVKDHDLVFTFNGWHDFSAHFDPFSGMMLASSVADGTGGADSLTAAELTPFFDTALGLWRAAGIDPARLSALSGAKLEVADLPGAHLGLTDQEMQTIWIDGDAAGHGWFMDDSPASAGALGPTAGEMDLLTVVTHEVGHLLGYDDNESDNIMETVLAPGTRIMPTDQFVSGQNATETVTAEPGVENFSMSAGVLQDMSAPAATGAAPMSVLPFGLVERLFGQALIDEAIDGNMVVALASLRGAPSDSLNEPNRNLQSASANETGQAGGGLFDYLVAGSGDGWGGRLADLLDASVAGTIVSDSLALAGDGGIGAAFAGGFHNDAT
jgi:hypothetical protein